MDLLLLKMILILLFGVGIPTLLVLSLFKPEWLGIKKLFKSHFEFCLALSVISVIMGIAINMIVIQPLDFSPEAIVIEAGLSEDDYFIDENGYVHIISKEE